MSRSKSASCLSARFRPCRGSDGQSPRTNARSGYRPDWFVCKNRTISPNSVRFRRGSGMPRMLPVCGAYRNEVVQKACVRPVGWARALNGPSLRRRVKGPTLATTLARPAGLEPATLGLEGRGSPARLCLLARMHPPRTWNSSDEADAIYSRANSGPVPRARSPHGAGPSLTIMRSLVPQPPCSPFTSPLRWSLGTADGRRHHGFALIPRMFAVGHHHSSNP